MHSHFYFLRFLLSPSVPSDFQKLMTPAQEISYRMMRPYQVMSTLTVAQRKEEEEEGKDGEQGKKRRRRRRRRQKKPAT